MIYEQSFTKRLRLRVYSVTEFNACTELRETWKQLCSDRHRTHELSKDQISSFVSDLPWIYMHRLREIPKTRSRRVQYISASRSQRKTSSTEAKVWKRFEKHLLIQSLEVLLLPDLEENLHWVAIIVNFGESRQIFLNLVPIPTLHEIFKVFHAEEETRFLFKPAKIQKQKQKSKTRKTYTG